MAGQISKADIRKILNEEKIFSIAAGDLGDDTRLTLDSLAVVWLVHRLEEEYGIVLDPDEVDTWDSTSLNKIHTLLVSKQ